MLRELLTSGMKPRLIAQNLHRSRSIMNFPLQKAPANGFHRNAPDCRFDNSRLAEGDGMGFFGSRPHRARPVTRIQTTSARIKGFALPD
jgi:hypothetical protein